MDSNGLDLLWDHYQLEGHTGHLLKRYNLAPRPDLNVCLIRLFCFILILSTSSRGPLPKGKIKFCHLNGEKLFVKKLAVT